MSRRVLICVLSVAGLMGDVSRSFAQTNTATLLGIVRDASGALIAGAQVKVGVQRIDKLSYDNF